MKEMKKWVLVFAGLLTYTVGQAQCAMCKAVVESGNRTGAGMTNTVNDGILYLMGVPYLLVGIVGFLAYRHYKKHQHLGNPGAV